MKFFIYTFLFLLAGASSIAQNSYKTTTGEIRFNASTPLEDIDALNKESNAILKSDSGKFAVVLLIKDFSFKRKLMQEHFNENYMESETFPKGVFSGTIKDFVLEALSSKPKKHLISGKMKIHGVTKEIAPEVYLHKKEGDVVLSSNFILRPEEFDIEVPKLLFNKIAKEVAVTVNLRLVAQ